MDWLSTVLTNWHDFFTTLKEKAFFVIGFLFAAFKWLFNPTAAWGAIWIVYCFSFGTKMLELGYNADEERLCFETFKSRFSSRVGLAKLTFKATLFMVLMGIFAQGQKVNPLLVSWVEPGVLTLLFVNESMNNVKHLSVHPSVKRLAKSVGTIFRDGFKKIFSGGTDDDLPLP